MTDYKLISYDPTPEMVSAAEDAYMPFGDMEMAIRMAILAAPAVQGEPLYMYRRRDLHDFITCNHERYAKLSAAPHLFETKVLYTAPQPAEQQPDVTQLVEALVMARGTIAAALRANAPDWFGTDEDIARHVSIKQIDAAIAASQPAEQQPCPEGIREGAPYDDSAFESLCREHEIWGTAAAAQCAVFWEGGKRAAAPLPSPDAPGLVEALESAKNLIANHSGEVLPDEYAGDQIEQIDAALAAYRKGGEP